MLFKRIIYLFIFIGVFVSTLNVFQSSVTTAGQSMISPVVTVSVPTATPTPSPKLPNTIVIPKLNVDANIEHVAHDKLGNMDVPQNDYNAAWYRLGVKPGEMGNSVIAGHLNTRTFANSIFYRLNELETGDIITVLDQSQKEWNFKVVRKEEFESITFPISLVFGPSERAMLNLITCSGTWLTHSQEYSKRLVVFSELI